MSFRLTAGLVAAFAAIAILLMPQHALADSKDRDRKHDDRKHDGGKHDGGKHDGRSYDGRGYDGRDNHRDRHAWRAPDRRVVYTYGRHDTRRTVVVDGPAYRRGGPPHWAPAHGYRHKQRQHWRRHEWHDTAPWHYGGGHYGSYRTAPGGGCNSSLLAGVIGGATGAVIGSQVGGGTGRLAATAAGTLIGAIAGIGIGETLDRDCIARTLEHAPDGGTVRWQHGPATLQPWQATPTATYQATDGRYCREFIGTATVGGQPQQVYGTACRQPDGSWEIVS
jgi:surface antigen